VKVSAIETYFVVEMEKRIKRKRMRRKRLWAVRKERGL
jgi:hypothetical protein